MAEETEKQINSTDNTEQEIGSVIGFDAKISWTAPEYHYHEKTNDWFWIVGIIIAGIIIASVMLDNIMFGVLAFAAGFALMLYGAKKPKLIQFSIDNKGITIEKQRYLYENLESFHIDYDPPHKKELLVKSKKTFMTLITIILSDEINLDYLHKLLSKHIKEEKLEESFITTISNFLKF